MKKEKQYRDDPIRLVPKDGVRCGNTKEGDWTPCSARNITIAEKENCNWYECPYHKFEFE